MRGLNKSYPGTRALVEVNLEVKSGEVLSVVGGNGSGKSTMIKVLAGVLEADSGTLEIGGRQYDLAAFTPALSKSAGVHVVHQHRTTFLSMTVAENLAIGRGFETGLAGRIRWGAARRRAEALIERFGIRVRPDDLVADLGPASQTMLEIARALQDQQDAPDGVILLDEPTAALPTQEVDLLLDAIRGYGASGQAVVFISHRLDEVLAISDRVTALRDGQVVAELTSTQLNRAALVTAMVGQPVEPRPRDAVDHDDSPSVLDVRGLSGGNVRNVDLNVRAGEVLGIAGLAGSGRSTLLRLLFGAQHRASGSLTLGGYPFAPSDPSHAVSAGVALVPEDRQEDAAFLGMSVKDNFTIAQVPRFTRLGRVDRRLETEATRAAIDRFRVKAPSEMAPIAALSGGNQQKVVIARWMIERPQLLLLDEPTQGVDVGARTEIWDIVLEAAAQGTAVIVVSSDLEELTHLSSRIAVMRGGRLVADLKGPGLTIAEVSTAMHQLEVGV